MKHLIDASALLLLIKTSDVKSTQSTLEESAILDLTFYEVGNAVWKETSLTKYLTPTEANKLGTTAENVLEKLIQLDNESEAFHGILKIAQTENLTYYDASYIYSAKRSSLQLITEDRTLGLKARKHVPVKTVAELTGA